MSNEDILRPIYKELNDKVKRQDFVTDKSGVKTVEIMDANVKGLDPEQLVLNFPGRKTPVEYVEKESRWYNSQSLNINDGVGDVKIWQQVADKDGFINSNYGWCIYSPENHKQFLSSLRELQKNPCSRRAVMIYNRPSMQFEYNRDGMSDFICTFSTQQFIRDNKLTYIVNQRSQDMIFGLFNDLAWHQEVYNKFYEELRKTYSDLQKGAINLNIASAHVYERHFPMLEKMVTEDTLIKPEVVQCPKQYPKNWHYMSKEEQEKYK